MLSCICLLKIQSDWNYLESELKCNFYQNLYAIMSVFSAQLVCSSGKMDIRAILRAPRSVLLGTAWQGMNRNDHAAVSAAV